MDTNMQEAKPRVYGPEEFRLAVEASRNHAARITEMMTPAATVYAAKYYGEAHRLQRLQNSVVADQVFDLAVAMAARVDQHMLLEIARLSQAKQDSGL